MASGQPETPRRARRRAPMFAGAALVAGGLIVATALGATGDRDPDMTVDSSALASSTAERGTQVVTTQPPTTDGGSGGGGGGGGGGGTTSTIPSGPAGCSLASAAFCADFQSTSLNTSGNRNGDLPLDDFSVSRWQSDAVPALPLYVTRANIDPCRAGASSNPFPPGDVLICDPSSSVASRHALLATAHQDYGDTLARINQPFDFAGRTGKIRFDATIGESELLLGFPVFFVTSEPYSAPSYLDDNAGGATPRDGFVVQFSSKCNGLITPKLRVFDDHAETDVPSTTGCSPVVGDTDRLSRVEVRVSRTRIEIWMSDPSSNGVDFGPLKLVHRSNVDLDFDRGYISFGVHNHATSKYGSIPSWSTLWDNVAFDGPVLAADRVVQVADAAVPSGSGQERAHTFDSDDRSGPFSLGNVDVSSVDEAQLVFNAKVDTANNSNHGAITFRYRLNGGTWRDVRLSAAEVALVPGRAFTFSFSVPVSVSDLRNGSNNIEFTGSGIFAGQDPFIGNIDLLLR